MNDKLGGKIISKFVGLGAKTYIYLTDNGQWRLKGKKCK